MSFLTIFDLDRTLLKKNSSVEFYKYLVKRKLVSKTTVFKLGYYYCCYFFNLFSLKKFHEKVFQYLLLGKSLSLLKKEGALFVEKRIIKLQNLNAVLRLQKAIFEKHYIVIISSSPDFIVEPIFNMLKVDAYFATEYRTDRKGNVKGIGRFLTGEEKGNIAKKIISKLQLGKERVFVYSDNIEDLPLLELAGHPVAVNPCQKLKKIAHKRGWEIL